MLCVLTQDLIEPLCRMNVSNPARFGCVDSTGILPLPRSAPSITRCKRECICNETSQYGWCTHHDVPASETPRFGEPWCEVLDPNCLDLFDRPPILVGGTSSRGSCQTPNTIRTARFTLPAASLNAMGLPPFTSLVLGIASRTMVIQPLLQPQPDGSARNGSLNDVFLDYETCFFHSSVPSTVNRRLVCEVLLAPRTSSPTTSGSPKIDFPLNDVSYGVSVNRKTFVNRVRFRSSNLDTFQIVYGTTGGGFLAGKAQKRMTAGATRKKNNNNKQQQATNDRKADRLLFSSWAFASHFSHCASQYSPLWEARRLFATTTPSPLTRCAAGFRPGSQCVP
jgi:hypothetical protein